MRKIMLLFVALATIGISFGCRHDAHKRDMVEMVKKHINCNLRPANKLESLEICRPDSTFGVLCLPEHQLEYIAKSIDNLSSYLMKQNFDGKDGKMAYLANKQMQASAYAAELFAYSQLKGDFNGWYVKAKYAVTYGNNIIKTEKWFFFNKEGDVIYNTFELPVP